MVERVEWPQRYDLSCAILVGGYSRRLGCDKATLAVDGVTLTERVATRLAAVTDDLMLVGNRLERFGDLPWRRVDDAIEGFGVLGGLYTALRAARRPYLFLAGCDMPFVEPALVGYLAGLAPDVDAVMPYVRGMPEPLHAVYAASCLPEVERLAASGERQLRRMFPRLRIRQVDEPEMRKYDPDLRSFFNVNTPADLRTLGLPAGSCRPG